MPTIHDVVARYRQLCDYCEAFSAMVLKKYGAEIHCARGCSGCCRLESVLGLEAWVLTDWRGLPESPDAARPPATADDEFPCPFLLAEACAIYPVRPIICRTHGLPLRSAALTEGKTDCCPLNFTGLPASAIEPRYLLDLDEITSNLVRLNLAFWMLLDRQEMAASRFSLSDIRAGRFSAFMKNLA